LNAIEQAEHRDEAHTKRNPQGTVPVLELADGTYISQVTAITMYLDNITGRPSALTGRNAKESGIIHMMQRRVEMELLDPVGIFFHHATPGLGPKNTQFKFPNWNHRNEFGEIYREVAWRGMKYCDEVLQKTPFMAGDEFSMADISLLAGLHFARISGIGVPQELKTLIAWNEKHYKERYPQHRPYEPNTPSVYPNDPTLTHRL
jgi:glutathione S-transferase